VYYKREGKKERMRLLTEKKNLVGWNWGALRVFETKKDYVYVEKKLND
jgi:hypothetical protein